MNGSSFARDSLDSMVHLSEFSLLPDLASSKISLGFIRRDVLFDPRLRVPLTRACKHIWW
jgi:hypothetical protein